MATLVICEKPSVAADTAKALSDRFTFQRTSWGFKSDQMWVTSAVGHLVAAAPPEVYNPEWKDWSFETLPMLPDRFLYQARDKRAAERLRTLASLIEDEQVTDLVNACDAGREGELIFKLIYQFSRSAKPVRRAWFSSMTAAAVRDAFSSLRPDAEMKPLEAAARCRAEADWLVGMNATRAASTTLGGNKMMLSLGRVQTPTLAMIVRRDIEIDKFVSTPFFKVRATFDVQPNVPLSYGARSFDGWWISSASGEPDAVDRLSSRDDAKALVAAVKGRPATISRVERSAESRPAPRLFDLTDLQREANRLYGMTATQTLAAAQTCYEKHKVLSYPRTDSRFLTSDMRSLVSTLLKRVEAADRSAYGPHVQRVLPSLNPDVLINDAKVTDHHALVPTNAAHDLSALSVDEMRIYDLVARRFIAAVSPPFTFERTVVFTKVDAAPSPVWFRSQGRHVTDEGWRQVVPQPKKAASKGAASDDDDAELPPLAESEPATVADVEVKASKTKPPPRFSEATLLAAMASAGRQVTDDELSEAMKESGLGTPATRAATIERLIKVGYVSRSGRSLRATDKGRGVVLSLGDHPLTKPDLTGKWERQLRLLEHADLERVPAMRAKFNEAVRTFTGWIVSEMSTLTPETLRANRRQLAPCPMPGCDGVIVEHPKSWGCSSWVSKAEPGCGFVFWKTSSGKRRTESQMLKFVEKVRNGTETVQVGPRERVELGPCPRCDGTVVERAKSWSCDSWKSPSATGCGYVIWKVADGVEVSVEQAREMLAAGTTNERKLVVIGVCPVCAASNKKSHVVDRGSFWGCDSYKSARSRGCGLMVFKNDHGMPRSETDLWAEVERQAAEGTPKPYKRRKRKR